ncbi:hypothetical protein F5Y16DRAFT_399915 [Xylariaceae sp. FL0255]|nr:hypothetical protein F5Y16DRAFT_399915 [Xylariaceae sp. FL0255]
MDLIDLYSWLAVKVTYGLMWLGIDPDIFFHLYNGIRVAVYNRGQLWPAKVTMWVNYFTIVFIVYNATKRFVGEWVLEEE